MMTRAVRRPLLMLLALAALALAFTGYLRPGFVLGLANQLWLCL